MIFVNNIKENHQQESSKAKRSVSLVLTEYRTDRLLYLSELIAVFLDKEPIKHIPADCIPYLIESEC